MKRRVSKRTNATTALLQHILDKECCSHVKVTLMHNDIFHEDRRSDWRVIKQPHTLRFRVCPKVMRYISAEGITDMLEQMRQVVDDYNRSWTEIDPSDMQRDIEIYAQNEQAFDFPMEVTASDEPDDV